MKTAIVAICLVFLPATALAQEFREPFENPGSGNNYTFAGKASPVIPSGRTITHLPTGGFNGTGGALIEVAGCQSGCPTEGNIGWDTPPLGGTYVLGQTRYVFFRIQLRSAMGHATAQKFVIFGGPNSGNRVMVMLDRTFGTNIGCHPSGEGNDYYGMFVRRPDPPTAWTRATEFGLPGTFTSLAPAPEHSNYAAITARVNIGWNCAPFAVVPNITAVGDIKPQQNAAITMGGWANVVIGFTSGPCGEQDIRLWVNNNDFNNPTTQALNSNIPGNESTCAIPVSSWGGSVAFGGYWSKRDNLPTRVVVDDFGVSNTFPVGFHRVPGTTLPPPPPSPLVLTQSAVDHTLAFVWFARNR